MWQATHGAYLFCIVYTIAVDVSWGPFYRHGLSNYIHNKICGEIIYPFSKFNGWTIEVWEGISNFIPGFTRHVITYPCGDFS